MEEGFAMVSHRLTVFLLKNVFIYVSFSSDAKRDVLRFATGAFACTAGRSEPLESD